MLVLSSIIALLPKSTFVLLWVQHTHTWHPFCWPFICIVHLQEMVCKFKKRFPVEITSSITAPSSQSSRPSEPLHVLPSTSTTPCEIIKSAIIVPLDSSPQCCRAQSRQSCRTQCGGGKSLPEEMLRARFSKAEHGCKGKSHCMHYMSLKLISWEKIRLRNYLESIMWIFFTA